MCYLHMLNTFNIITITAHYFANAFFLKIQKHDDYLFFFNQAATIYMPIFVLIRRIRVILNSKSDCCIQY